MSYALWINYKFIPPYPLDKQQFEEAKDLQKSGSQKITYLATVDKPNLKSIALVFGILYGLTFLFELFFWFVSLDLPTSGAALIYNGSTFESILGFITLGLFYASYRILWEYFTAVGYNKRLHRMVKKSESYEEFRKTYHYRYGK